MAVTTYWLPNQATIKQKRKYTFTAPNSVGNTYKAKLNGKTITYTSVANDTAALAATGLFDLVKKTTSIAPEFTEIKWTNPSDGVVEAEAKVAGTPFAIDGVTGSLTLETGNGLANGITTEETTANASPSDVNDAENWWRVDLATTPPNGSRALPQNTDDVIVSDSDVPMLWNLDGLKTIEFNTYERTQSMTGQIGLPETNPGGYTEWRTGHFQFVGPQGSTPAGGLVMRLGVGEGGGPPLERYDLQSQKTTLQIIDGTEIDFVGQHTENSFTLLGSATLNVATGTGNKSNLSSSTVDGSGSLVIGKEVTWTASSTLTIRGGAAELAAAPDTIDASNEAVITVTEDGLTWATVTAQGGCTLNWLAGGTITTLTLSQSCTLDKSLDVRGLTITNSTIDGDTCIIVDPLNAITFTNATSVKQSVTQGPFLFTGTRTVKVT